MDAVLLDTDVFSFLARTRDTRGDAYRPYVKGASSDPSHKTDADAFSFGWLPSGLPFPVCSIPLATISSVSSRRHPYRDPDLPGFHGDSSPSTSEAFPSFRQEAVGAPRSKRFVKRDQAPSTKIE
jgi:hypothetical protein